MKHQSNHPPLPEEASITAPASASLAPASAIQQANRLNRWLTLGANLGVIVGLFILIVEVRQNADLTRAQMQSGRNDLLAQIELSLATPEIGAAWVKSIRSPETLTDLEVRIVESHLVAVMLQLDHMFNMEKIGLVSREEARRHVRNVVPYYFGSRHGKNWWRWQEGGWDGTPMMEVAGPIVDQVDATFMLRYLEGSRLGRSSGEQSDAREPLNKSMRSAFQSEKPQIVRAAKSDSSRSYGRVASRARCGFSGETRMGRAFAGPPARLGSLIWNNQTALAQAEPGPPAEAPSRPRRLVQRIPNDIEREAQQFMDHYAADLRSHDRSALAARYDRGGATVVFNGERNARTFDEIQARYREQWIGPVSFEWRDLAYEVLGPDSVIVTGEFDWGQPDGIEGYSYSGILQRREGALRIRLEVESLLPDGQP